MYFVKKKEANWVVLKKGASRSIKIVGTQAEAIKLARQLAKKQGARLSIYKSDGKLKETISYVITRAKPGSKTKKAGGGSKKTRTQSTLFTELKSIIKKTGQKPRKLATDAEIARVEKRVGMKFPPDYKSFLKRGGAEIDCRFDLFAVKSIAKETKDARKYSGFPDSLVPIGYSNGDYFCIHESGKVAWWYHDSKMVEKNWNSMKTFLRNYVSKNLAD